MYDSINIQYLEYSIYCILILSYVNLLFYDLIGTLYIVYCMYYKIRHFNVKFIY